MRISFLFVWTLGQSSQNLPFFSRHSRGICGFLQYKQRSLHFQYSLWGMRCPTLEPDTQGLCRSKQLVPTKHELGKNILLKCKVYCLCSKHDMTLQLKMRSVYSFTLSFYFENNWKFQIVFSKKKYQFNINIFKSTVLLNVRNTRNEWHWRLCRFSFNGGSLNASQWNEPEDYVTKWT